MISTLTPQAIANSLNNIPKDGSSWLIPNWHYQYRNMKFNLIQSLKYDINWNKINFVKDIHSLQYWKNNTENWEEIIENDDVAMFPSELICLKKFYIIHTDMDCCERINQLSYNIIHSEYSEFFKKQLIDFYAEYGVFRFRCTIGENLYKMLRRHLKITHQEFQETYGVGLFFDKDCCDELLIEMLCKGRLSGAVRSYKIESDGFYGL